MNKRTLELKKEQIPIFEEVKETNRITYTAKRKLIRRSSHRDRQIKKQWEHEDAIRSNKRQKQGLA